MFQLNTSQACEFYNVLEYTIFQIRECSESLYNRGAGSIIILPILNYEILNIC